VRNGLISEVAYYRWACSLSQYKPCLDSDFYWSFMCFLMNQVLRR
jgi:hypothetical protein